MYKSNCCDAPIWQPDANGHCHCSECGETCTPQDDGPLSKQDRAELIARLRAAQDAATDENEKNLLRAKRLRLEAGKVRETGMASLIREMGGAIRWEVDWDECEHVPDIRHEMQFNETICAECGAHIK